MLNQKYIDSHAGQYTMKLFTYLDTIFELVDQDGEILAGRDGEFWWAVRKFNDLIAMAPMVSKTIKEVGDKADVVYLSTVSSKEKKFTAAGMIANRARAIKLFLVAPFN